MTELMTLEALERADAWTLREFARLCCGGPQRPFDLLTYESARELIVRAVGGGALRATRYCAESREEAIGNAFYEADLLFAPSAVIDWARRTFPSFPTADVFAIETPKPLQLSFGQRLEALRDEARLTVAELAEGVGLEKTSVDDHRSDRTLPRRTNLRQYERFFSEKLGRRISFQDSLPGSPDTNVP